MSISYLFNVWALVLFAFGVVFSFLIYRKCECKNKIVHIADLVQYTVMAVTLCALAIMLSDLTNFSFLGKGLSFVILSNFYAALFNVACRIFRAFSK